MYKAIEAMMILHNICIDWNDSPEEIWDYDPANHWENDGNDEDDGIGGDEEFNGDAQVPEHETE